MTNTQAAPERRPAESLGSLFLHTRTSQGKSLAEAAEATRIPPTTLAALESDNFDHLPAEVFTRGFIKLYAEYLGLDANETLKLYVDQENLDPERPADRPYRRDILFGTAMAHPLTLLKGNPRVRIIVILLAALLGFYAVGALLKSVQKHPDQMAPENEVAKALVDSNTPPIPGPDGEAVPAAGLTMETGVAGTAALNAAPPEAQPGSFAPPGELPGQGSVPAPAAETAITQAAPPQAPVGAGAATDPSGGR